jgi:L-cysteine:1D-myo-inositol 2-amino-2-deoxy-alpha-D-glucopyranoside ligase
MRTWTVRDSPVLPGRGFDLRVHDSASGGLRNADTGDVARIYVCGITPYDATHLGHAATYAAFDVLCRAWRDSGRTVRYVQNITDVDDPLFERAEATGVSWRELADTETTLFADDMAWLNVLPPTHFVGAAESTDLIIDIIERLKAASAVYDVDGDLYFSVRSDASFGSISGLDDATMRALSAERGGDPDRPGKSDPLDSLLWRRERPGEPAWDSPFGRGRPGWHIECTAIALSYLGEQFDVQGGGNDLIFPHHEMCASQGRLATGGSPFARAYVHAGMLGLDGEKMSKSLGNLVFASHLRRDGTDPYAVRLALLSQHYRLDRPWNRDLLASAEARLVQWRSATAQSSGPDAVPVLDQVRKRLADDLDTPGAIAAIDVWAASANAGANAGDRDDSSAPGLIRDLCDALLGINLHT